MHHIGVGRDQARQPVVIPVGETTVTIASEILGTYFIEPYEKYRRNQQMSPADSRARCAALSGELSDFLSRRR